MKSSNPNLSGGENRSRGKGRDFGDRVLNKSGHRMSWNVDLVLSFLGLLGPPPDPSATGRLEGREGVYPNKAYGVGVRGEGGGP